MKKDYFRENSALDKGRKKVYTLKEGNIELLNPKDGKSVGYLEKGELVYKVNTVEENGEKLLVFRVIKYAGKKHQNTLFKASKSLFERHYSDEDIKKSSVEGDAPKAEDKKMNFGVPVVTGLGVGVVSYLLAKKYGKNVWIFGGIGLALGAIAGHLIVNKNMIKKK